MLVVPVLDLMAGQVVHARRGERASYGPVRSRLCSGSDPLQVLAAILALYPFPVVYVADLDAIRGGAPQRAVLEALRQRHAGVELWVDAGFGGLEQALADGRVVGATPVVGSETLLPAQAPSLGGRADVVLSLDFRRGRFIGPDGLDTQPGHWPQRVLAMNLDRVGAGEGPDGELVGALVQRAGGLAPGVRVFASGGVRDVADLHAAAAAGAAGALVASALHGGTISGAELRNLADGEARNPLPR